MENLEDLAGDLELVIGVKPHPRPVDQFTHHALDGPVGPRAVGH